MTGGTSIVLMPSMLGACSANEAPVWLEGWQGPVSGETDIRWIVLSYAILAANSHNTQPWIVDLTGPQSLDLYVDRQRLLPETDPPARQIHISQGTFLENLDLAARHHGHRAIIDYFPQGQYANTVVEDKPVAAVRLEKTDSVSHDRLFNMLLQRQSNKRNYRDVPLSAAQLTRLGATVTDPRLHLGFSNDAALRSGLSDILTTAMQIETASRRRDAETLAMFRFSDEERRQHRDGFGVAQSGMGGFKGWMVERFFLSRIEAETDSTSFGQQSVDMTAGQARSAAAFGWITTSGNTRRDQVITGRAYERLNLQATALGIAMHPMSQVLQEYPDMTDLQQRFLTFLRIPAGHTVQMLFRVGIAAPVEHSPRRAVRDLRKA